MYQYIWDSETGGLLLTTEISKFSKEPRPVYYKELDILGFDKYWNYPKDDSAPLMWAESNNYIYKGRTVAKAKGGTLYSPPEIIILDNPEPENVMLEQVNITKMVEKNNDILETLTQETIRKVYNVYHEFQKKVDVFYVAFSGGKDSIVVLDLIQKTLPHDDFLVLFGDTRMEFSDTYQTVEKVMAECAQQNIRFYTSRSDFTPAESWRKFGPPSTVTRWCCSVHKTAPQVLLIRDILNKPNFSGMAFVGVRGDESTARSKYDFVSYEGKHKGQYSCNVVLDWSSAEVFLYIYKNNLVMNEAYKKGNRRVGCLICPRAAERNDYMNHHCYSAEAEVLVDAIRAAYEKTFPSSERLEEFIKNGGWKARKNGRDVAMTIDYTERKDSGDNVEIHFSNPRTDWKEWIKTIGVLVTDESPYRILFKGNVLTFRLESSDNTDIVTIDKDTAREYPEFVKLLKNVFRKAAACVGCKECQADCPFGNLIFVNGQPKINDQCKHCAQCHKVEKGCLVAKSLEQPKGGIIMSGKNMSLNSYSHHAPKMEWVNQYFAYKDEFDDKHSLGSQMYNFFKRFLRDAQLLDKTGFSTTAKVIDSIGIEEEKAWGIIYTNLCYAVQVNWYVNHVAFNMEYSKELLASMMVDDGAKESWTNDIFSSLIRLSELPMGKLGFGDAVKEKNRAVSISRSAWENPDAKVILYSLYKFAEACGDYYQFTLESLLDDSIERDGVSPTRIFGLDRESMVRILNGLAVNYPEFISASFTLDLDTITLRPTGVELTSEDVLKLF